MQRRLGWKQTARGAAPYLVVFSAFLGLAVGLANAGERKFVVMLANSPKQFPGTGQPPDGLANPENIRQQYFDKIPNNGIDSFAEYWEEISYGDVTITGLVTDWINLPWAVRPQGAAPGDYVRLDPSGSIVFRYGTSERFHNFEAMVRIDIDGDPNGTDNGPFPAQRGPGGNDVSQGRRNVGRPVWMPGFRFLDMDNDGRWDGLDEARNQMDWNGDGQPDLLGPWLDLDGDGEPSNASPNCLYLRDSDNDGNPDCCPNGPGAPGCEGIQLGPDANACPSTQWTGLGGVDFQDCNGNLIPDACDVSCTSAACMATGWLNDPRSGAPSNPTDVTKWACGKSLDRVPFVEGQNQCVAGAGDGIPDECQFTNYLQDCVQTAIVDPMNPCSGRAVCVQRGDRLPPLVRCEFDDSNRDGRLDVVEPFESFIRIGRHRAVNEFGDPDPGVALDLTGNIVTRDCCSANGSPGCSDDGCQDRVCFVDMFCCDTEWDGICGALAASLCSSTCFAINYIRDNYPGDAQKLIDRSTPRQLWGVRDPLGKLNSQECICDDGDPCRVAQVPNAQGGMTTLVGACPAGQHIAFASPDRWFDQGNMKMVPERLPLIKITPEPPWYEDAWRDRYQNEGCESPIPEHETDPAVPATVACNPPEWRVTFPDRPDDFAPSDIPSMIELPLEERRYFSANRGGLNGDGTGWTPRENQFIVFTSQEFEEDLNRPILPEEMNGLGQPIILFDGFVEYDDLPSSKYHRGGDKGLGEVTSPFNNDFWGQDLQPLGGPDGFIEAAGPYAVNVHGNLDFDAGNVLNMELLTWRWEPPFNNGLAWQGQNPAYFHPYASVLGEGLGFRDFNLDGMLDRGETRPFGSENYVLDHNPQLGLVPGTATEYPFNRRRLLEDCIEVLDFLVDLNIYVDTESLAAAQRSGYAGSSAPLPVQYQVPGHHSATIRGLLSGIVLLSQGSHIGGDFLTAPLFYPIHNEDNTDVNDMFPHLCNNICPFANDGECDDGGPGSDFNVCGLGTDCTDCGVRRRTNLSWNLFVHDLVIQLGDPRSAAAFQTAYSAHEYLHTWEGFPDLYDYDIYNPNPGVVINTPVGRWDIMAGSGQVPIGLVHPVPILKEKPGTEWIQPVDLTTVLTPGVNTTITLPRSEFVRDDSHFFFENEDNLRERFYFWSVGSGFNRPRAGGGMPGVGMLVLHTNVSTNPFALPSGQQNATNFEYLIVQADGLHQLEAGLAPFGDAGDPWPGTTNNRTFNCTTNPASQWYNLNACTGLSIVDVSADGQGAAQVTFNWQPTGVPSLSFINPPGGTSVNDRYTVRFSATDRFGGTLIRMYFTADPEDVSVGGNLVGTLQKNTAGTGELSIPWTITGVPDGVYHLFAALVPGAGPGGSERAFTVPRKGRNNVGNGTLTVANVDIAGNNARLETWHARCIDAGGSEWIVTSTLTQPEPKDDDPDQDPYPHAMTGVPYTSLNNAVTFTINEGGTPFTLGDTFAFTTTGITAASETVTITNGIITENPIAVLVAAPLSGRSPLTVHFDARQSRDPAGQPLTYSWNFGDGTTATGDTVSHTFIGSRTFTVTLRATNPLNGRFGEATVDVVLENNSPRAVIAANPQSGAAPLNVRFSAADSSDTETPANQLIYRWNFGDNTTAGDGVPGSTIEVDHLYIQPGTYNAVLTVTDDGGKSATASIQILVGNTVPTAVVTTSTTQGASPLTVLFNASGSSDADGDPITVTWMWGDGTANETWPVSGPPNSGGNVPHTYLLPQGQTQATFTPTAILSDGRGGNATWPGVTITVTTPPPGVSDPRAIFSINPDPPVAGQVFEADGSASFDRPGGGAVASYTWSWGDNTANSTGAKATHTYANPGTYTISLTVADSETPPNTNTATKSVVVAAAPQPGDDNRPPTAIILVSPSEGVPGTTFTFDGRNSSDPDEGDTLTYQWVFGDGGSGTGAVVTHAYEAVGNYTVRLTVRDSFNASTDATRTVVVRDVAGNADPVAFIASGLRSGPAPLTISFNGQNSYDPDGDPLTFTWRFRLGDTLIDTQGGAVVTRTFSSAGTYSVELEVSDGRGGVDTVGPQTITVTAPLPPPDDDTTRPPPDDPAPLPVRPPQICGLGMLTGMFGVLLGLVATLTGRRRMGIV